MRFMKIRTTGPRLCPLELEVQKIFNPRKMFVKICNNGKEHVIIKILFCLNCLIKTLLLTEQRTSLRSDFARFTASRRP